MNTKDTIWSLQELQYFKKIHNMFKPVLTKKNAIHTTTKIQSKKYNDHNDMNNGINGRYNTSK